MAKNNDNSAPGCLIGIFSVIFVVFFGFLKLIIDGIRKFFRWIIKTRKCNKTINDITILPFEKANIKAYDDNLLNDLKDILNIFDKNYYNSIFPIQIRNRGEVYYEKGKIKKYQQQDNKYSCIVEGTNEYNVSIEFVNNSNEIKNMYCTCPYFNKNNNFCKHTYALLYKIKCSNNKEEIIREIYENINGNKKMINDFQKYLEIRENVFTSEIIEKYCQYIHRYDKVFSNIENNITNLYLEDTLIKYLLEIIKIRHDLSNKICEMVYFEWELISRKKSDIPTSLSTIKATAKLAGATFLSSLFNSNDSLKDRNLSEYNDNELDDFALDDWQKDLVKEGKYDPWNFEEEDLEEDDYYFEDDE